MAARKRRSLIKKGASAEVPESEVSGAAPADAEPEAAPVTAAKPDADDFPADPWTEPRDAPWPTRSEPTADVPREPTVDGPVAPAWADGWKDAPWAGDSGWADAFKGVEGWAGGAEATRADEGDPYDDWGTSEVVRTPAPAPRHPTPPPVPRASAVPAETRKEESGEQDAGVSAPPARPRAVRGGAATILSEESPMLPNQVSAPTPNSAADRPSYKAETPPPAPQAAARPWVRPDFDDEGQEAVVVVGSADEPRRNWLWPLISMAGIGMLGAGGLAVVFLLDLRQIAADVIPEPPEGAAGQVAGDVAPARALDAGGVEVRSGLRQAPKFEGVDPSTLLDVQAAAAADPPPGPRPSTTTGRTDRSEVAAPRQDSEVGGTLGVPAPPPPPAPPVTSPGADVDVAAPTVTQPPKVVSKPPVVQAGPDPATVGTLKIRSNRRVLIYVDGKAVGYAPTDYPVTPGSHVVRAMVPGQPTSAQTQEIQVAAAGSVLGVDFTF